MLEKDKIKEECQKIYRQLERLEDLTSALVTRIIKINKYSSLHKYTDNIIDSTNELYGAVDKLEWDLDWKGED